MTRAEFATKVRALHGSGLGALVIRDYDGSAIGHPYRMATLRTECNYSEGPARAASWLALAIEVTGYLTIHTSGNVCDFGISITVDIEQDPAKDAPDVTLDAVLADGEVRP